MSKHVLKIIKKSEYNYSVTIPKEVMEKYGWQAKQKVVLTDKGRGRLEIRDWRSN